MFATALTVGVAVISCKKKQAVQTTAEVLDEKIPTDDESIANELFAMHAGLTKNDKGNNKIKAEVNQTPKEINKAVFLIEAYLNYEYDDSTAFELTSIDTSYITIPATLVNNNKYAVDYAKFIEAYEKSEIETISHKEREKLKLTNPTVVVIDIELVTPEDPKTPQKEFVTRVITVMGYQQQAGCFPNDLTNCNNFKATEYWAFDSSIGANGLCNSSGTCTTSNARMELEKKANLCNKYGCPDSFFSNVTVLGGQPVGSGLNIGLIVGPYSNWCIDPPKMNQLKNRIYSNSLYFKPAVNQQIRATTVEASINMCNSCPSELAYRLTVTYAKCSSKSLYKKIYSEQ